MSIELDRLREKVHNYPSPSSYNRLISLLLAASEIDQAESFCKRSMRDFPRNAQAYMFLADIELQRNNLPNVQTLLHKAVTQDPRHIPWPSQNSFILHGSRSRQTRHAALSNHPQTSAG